LTAIAKRLLEKEVLEGEELRQLLANRKGAGEAGGQSRSVRNPCVT
jgi:hypothetical protein